MCRGRRTTVVQRGNTHRCAEGTTLTVVSGRLEGELTTLNLTPQGGWGGRVNNIKPHPSGRLEEGGLYPPLYTPQGGWRERYTPLYTPPQGGWRERYTLLYTPQGGVGRWDTLYMPPSGWVGWVYPSIYASRVPSVGVHPSLPTMLASACTACVPRMYTVWVAKCALLASPWTLRGLS